MTKKFLNEKRYGSTGEGSHHWILMRLTSLVLLFLMPWLMIELHALAASGLEVQAQMAWIQNPWNMIGFILLLGVGAHHSANGMQVVFEDYISHRGIRLACIYSFKALTYFMALFALLALVKVF